MSKRLVGSPREPSERGHGKLQRAAGAWRLRRQLEQDAIAFLNAIVPVLPLLRASRGNVVAVTTAATSRYPVRDGLSSIQTPAVESGQKLVVDGGFGV